VKCADCKRLLRAKPALEISTREGVLRFGPVCAKRYIVRPTRTAWKVVEKRAVVAPPVDPRQLTLELA
jgi:hypothetical protein